MTDTETGMEGSLKAMLHEALAQIEQYQITLRTVADFPITDHNNMDAINMAAIAASALPSRATRER